MFPGYVFVALAAGELLHLKRTNSVAQKIEAADEEALVYDLRSVQRIERTNLDVVTSSKLEDGERVKVLRGPLAGITGSILRHKNRTRLQIVVEAIRQAVIVDVAAEDVVSLFRCEASSQRERSLPHPD